jgi:hypothetical protein
VDGDTSTFSHTDDLAATWEVDLGQDYNISFVSIKNRFCGGISDTSGCLCRLTGARVTLFDSNSNAVKSASFDNTCGNLNPVLDFDPCVSDPFFVMARTYH